ncbi:hypothetical protein VF02_37930, partial [Nostoc linckia z1]
MSEGNKGGAPTKYKAEYADQVYKLCLLGATDKEIGDFFNVCETTINNWKLGYSEFLESISRGKVQADAEIGGKLYQLASGFEYKEQSFGENGEGSFNITNVRYNVPDFRAVRFWLMNRHPDKWREKQEVV